MTLNNVISVPFAALACFWDRNNSRYTEENPEAFKWDEPENKTLTAYLRETKGYDPSKEPMVISPITKSDKERWLKQQRGEYADLKAKAAAGDKAAEVELTTFEEVFCEGKDKSIREPTHLVDTGNRRYKCLWVAMVQTRRDGLDKGVKEGPKANQTLEAWGFRMDVQAVVRTYKSESERIMDQLSENNRKTEGVKRLNHAQIVFGLKKAMSLGGVKQAELRKEYGHGNGQRYHGFVVLANRFPQLRLYERAFKKGYAEQGEYGVIRFESLDQNLGWLVRRSDKDELEASNLRRQAENERKGVDPNTHLEEFMDATAVNHAIIRMVSGDGKGSSKVLDATVKDWQKDENPIRAAQAKAFLDKDKAASIIEEIKYLDKIVVAAAIIHERSPETFTALESLVQRVSIITDETVIKHVLSQLETLSFVVPAPAPEPKGKGAKGPVATAATPASPPKGAGKAKAKRK